MAWAYHDASSPIVQVVWTLLPVWIFGALVGYLVSQLAPLIVERIFPAYRATPKPRSPFSAATSPEGTTKGRMEIRSSLFHLAGGPLSPAGVNLPCISHREVRAALQGFLVLGIRGRSPSNRIYGVAGKYGIDIPHLARFVACWLLLSVGPVGKASTSNGPRRLCPSNLALLSFRLATLPSKRTAGELVLAAAPSNRNSQPAP